MRNCNCHPLPVDLYLLLLTVFALIFTGEELHLLPRRVLCILPDTNIALSEYVFPDEGLSEAANSLQEVLGFPVNPNDIMEYETKYGMVLKFLITK